MSLKAGSFVQALDIASDPRLAGFGDAAFMIKGGARKGVLNRVRDGSERPGIVSENMRAAVNAGSILSFVAGLNAAEKSDVLYSTQLAQRAATARHDRFKATKEWYDVYVDILERLGWVGEGFAFTDRGSAAGAFSMDKSALDVIATIASGNQLAILVKTLDTLKKLGDGDRALRIFDIQAMAELSGNFQLGAVQKADNDAISLALGAFHFETSDHRGRVLFWKWGAETIRFWTAVRKMSLNRIFYAKHREAVISKLAADAAEYVADLAIV